MKKIFYLLLLLSLFFCNCNNVVKAPKDKPTKEEIVETPAPKIEQCTIVDNTPLEVEEEDEYEDESEPHEIIGSRVHRIIQKNIQGCYSVPLVLLDNDEILSNDDDEKLYLLKPGDSVYYSNKGEIEKVVYADKKSNSSSAKLSTCNPDIVGSKVYRVSQKILQSNQGYYSVPLLLLENEEILSDDDNDMLYLLKPGDLVYYSTEGYITNIVYANKKAKGCATQLPTDDPSVFGSKVYRIAQKIIPSSQGCHSIPIILLENEEILSDDDDDLYLLKQGDSVYYSNDGYIIEVVYADKKTKGRS